MTYEKIDPGHAPVAAEEPTDMACSCNCSCTCVCGATAEATKQAAQQGREFEGDMTEESIVPG